MIIIYEELAREPKNASLDTALAAATALLWPLHDEGSSAKASGQFVPGAGRGPPSSP